ncbi:laccase [Leptolyngbya sp. 'hensonii']|uniref:peptidoglycan editing factor PgeF n=1 Tax=Leptolyngbya sp. 'hensonii' TaxID=1922337 RepID=UPI00094F999C|nr:peptidoglycan editing factor PgeF [Leptolyngbya sp. 'hensonii']OLP18519.1 laccase [Leptolyngbya sp. 'hensonii']
MNESQTWRWKTWNNLPYLTCSLLDPWPHGFFTQQFRPRSPQELTSILHDTTEVYRMKQVHGNTVLSATEVGAAVTEFTAELELPQADGLMTEQSAQAVWVCTADCSPVLIADPGTGQVAAIHAGWRGTATRIVPTAIARLQEQGSQLSDLKVAIGPAIAGEVYQVAEAVAVEVGETIAPKDVLSDAGALLEALQNLPQPPILPDPEPGRVRLDVRRVITLQLLQLGIGPEQVEIAPHCTYQQPEYFFSYRRTGEKQVQWSGIVSQ